MNTMHQMKRSCLHNLYVTSSKVEVDDGGIPEGLVLPPSLLRLTDIEPFERVVVTKIGSDNWANRIYTFILPGEGETVEARGSVAHFLKEGDLCCIISGTYFTSEQFKLYSDYKLPIPILDIRLYPDGSLKKNDLSNVKLVLEQFGSEERVDVPSNDVLDRRKELPRIWVSNMLTGLRVEIVERLCIEMSAELPVEHMAKAGFVKNQSIFVYNSSRGGMSAESYVVPSMQQKKVGISGALSRVADLGDLISEVAFVVSTDRVQPTIYNL